MGFLKTIELENGVPVSYHRITMLSIHTNNQNVIEVSSYVSASKRQEEAECTAKLIAGLDAECKVFVEAHLISAPYDPSMTIESAYEYLLTLPEFDGAEIEETEFMLDAEATIPDIQEELANQESESE